MKQKVEIVEIGVEGNTISTPITSPVIKKKQSTQYKFWCFTLFIEEGEDKAFLEFLEIDIICKKYFIGIEKCPTTQKRHLQGFFELVNKKRLEQLIKNKYKWHLEHCKGSETQNKAYCSKANIAYSFGYPIKV